MSRDADDRVHVEESRFSVFCFRPDNRETPSRTYRVQISPGGTRGYRGVILDISPDLPVQQRPMRVFECEDESLVRVEIQVLKEIRERHPQLLVQRYPAKQGSSAAAKSAGSQKMPSSVAPEAAAPPPPQPVLDRSDIPALPQMSLLQAYRTAMLIANDESDELPTRESLRDLAKVLAKVINTVAEMEDAAGLSR